MSFGIESFLVKIFLSVLKQSAPALSKGLSILSTYQTAQDVMDVVDSFNNCNEYSVGNLHVRSDQLAGYAKKMLLDIGTDRIFARDSRSGLYLESKASRPFEIPNYNKLRNSRQQNTWALINELDRLSYSISRASSMSDLTYLGPKWQNLAVRVKNELSDLGISAMNTKFLRKLESMDVSENVGIKTARNVVFKVTSLANQFFRNKLLGLPVDDLY
ncbi:hypothetical protein ACFL9T_23440 [Thermodesulfobacteriota bacterium]